MGYWITVNKKIVSIAVIVLLLPLVFYGWRYSLRPPRITTQQTLFSGISYQRKIYSQPRPLVVHVVTIDLTTPGIQPFVTPPKSQSTISQNPALTTSKLIDKFDLQIAINGSFFYPFRENTPWDYYPRAGEPANVLGESIANGRSYGAINNQWHVLCFAKSNLAQIPNKAQCPPNTVQGIAGMEKLVFNSVSVVNADTEAYARTAVAINSQGDRLWLILVDGKQPYYSEGVTLKELAAIAVNLGADRAINLDGGGSTTLAIADSSKVKIINAPIHNKIPMNERPIANHLGFYASP